MSYMKQKWLEAMEQEEKLPEGCYVVRWDEFEKAVFERLTGPYPCFVGQQNPSVSPNLASLTQPPAQLVSLPVGVNAGTVLACVIEIDLYKKCRPTCCRCGGTNWSNFSFQEDKKVAKVTDVGETLVYCLHIGCGWTGELQSVIHPTERSSLYADVKNWLQNQATATVAPPVGLKAIMEGAGQEEVESFYEGGWGSDPGEPVPPKTRVPRPTCEADKPEGTRDVDKFLKEQQEKLWRGE